MTRFNKSTFVRELKRQIKDPDRYGPLQIRTCTFEPVLNEETTIRPDFEISFAWQERDFHFFGEFEVSTSPRKVNTALKKLATGDPHRFPQGSHALLALPYISSSIAALLEKTSVSVIDLNGNYLLQTNELVAIRLDRDNQYKQSGGIKNVFRGKSSIVSRYLLREPGPHETVSGIHDRIRGLGGRVSLSTVSKVLSTLNDEMILEKGSQIRVLQPERLMERLRQEYRSPSSIETVPLRLPDARSEKEEILDTVLNGELWVWGGEAAAARYTTTTPSQEDKVYTRELPLHESRLEEFRDKRFYNCILYVSQDDFLYFGHEDHWVSAIQTYLELMQGDKREREIARDLEDQILNRFHDADYT